MRNEPKCPKCGQAIPEPRGGWDSKWDYDHDDGGTYQFDCLNCGADLELHWEGEQPVVTLDPLHV